MYDVIIIGAGVEGSATGYHLTSKTSKKVLLLEQVCYPHDLVIYNNYLFSLIEDIQEVVHMVDPVSQGELIIKAIM